MKFDFAGLLAARCAGQCGIQPARSASKGEWQLFRGAHHKQSIFAAILALVASWSASTPPSSLHAAEPVRKGVTSRAVREDALRAIPFQQIAPDARAKVSAVLNDVSIFRRLPTQSIDCDPALFHFLVANPDVVVNIWRVMGVTNVSMDRHDTEHFRGSDGDGTTCRAEFVFHNHDTHVIYGEGVYDGPLFPRPIRGQCVAVLKTAEIRETNGRYFVTCRLDLFLHVDNAGVELVAKMFQGWLGKTIDHNFTETIAFLGNVSHTAETNPQGMRKLAGRLNRVDADHRSRFALLTDQVAGNLTGVDLASGQQPAKARP